MDKPEKQGRAKLKFLNNKNKAVKTAAIVLSAAIITVIAVGGIVYNIRGSLPKDNLPAEFTDKLKNDDAEKKNTTDTRIMSANLLVHYESWGGTDAAERAKMFIEVLNTYSPDVIGAQEVCDQWFCCLNKNMPEKYKFINGVKTGLFSEFTTIIYNSDTVKIVEKGSEKLTNGTDRRTRRIEWALFERIDNGKQFIAVSTHFDLLHENKIAEELPILQSQAEHLSAFTETLSKKYNCPVILTGDYNSMEDTLKTRDVDAKEIYIYLSEKLTDVKKSALRAKSGNGWSLSEPVYDHIFLKGDCDVTLFRLLSDLSFSEMSDHYPIFADFDIQ